MDEYKKIISELIKRHMGIIGPGVTLSVARKILSLKISGDGEVTEIGGAPEQALRELQDTFNSFFGESSRIILSSVLKKYPHTHL